MKILLIARKYLLELLREPQLLLTTLLLPLVFIFITEAIYGHAPKLVTHKILIYDQSQSGENILSAMEAERYADGRPVFSLKPVSNPEEGIAALKNKEAALMLELSDGPNGKAAVRVVGDATSTAFINASPRLDRVGETVLSLQEGKPILLQFQREELLVHSATNEFDLYVPGMIIFAILFIIPQTTMIVGRELRNGTYRRLAVTPLRPAELLSGIGLSQVVTAVVSTLLVFSLAMAFGFHNNGSLLLAILIAIILSLSSIVQGLVVACFISDDSQATNIGSVVTMLQVFLSGSFFAIPQPLLFNLGGRSIGLFDIFPATHGGVILRQVMNSGAGWEVIGFRFGAILVLTLLYGVVSIWLFNKKKMA